MVLRPALFLRTIKPPDSRSAMWLKTLRSLMLHFSASMDMDG
jgi:hypothetical protein